jgi:hypothetical protein
VTNGARTGNGSRAIFFASVGNRIGYQAPGAMPAFRL